MALTPSTMPPLGTPMPAFSLFDVTRSAPLRSDEITQPVVVIAFWCNHCPYVQHIEDSFVAFCRERDPAEVAFLAICSNDEQTHPEDGPGPMAERAKAHAYCFPYLHDATQSVARAFGAACTPDFFVYDADHRLFYRGQLDDSRPGKGTPDGKDLRAALDALLSGDDPPGTQWPSAGCGIKWKV